jgi:hypothetical protein
MFNLNVDLEDMTREAKSFTKGAQNPNPNTHQKETKDISTEDSGRKRAMGV